MNKKEQILLVGGGGHCKACIDVIELAGIYQIAGIVDLPERIHQNILGYEIIGSDSDLPEFIEKYKNVLITIGQIKNPCKRIEIFKQINDIGAKTPVVISPLAHVSEHAAIKEGTIVMHHALINAGANVGKNCIINTKAIVEHDAAIGDNCHISTGAIINGNVSIERDTFIGSNTMTRESITIGKQSVIGGGARILRNVPAKSFITK